MVGIRRRVGEDIRLFRSRILGGGIQLRNQLHARAEFADVYVADRWMFSSTMTEAPRSGSIGSRADDASVSFAAARVADLEPYPY